MPFNCIRLNRLTCDCICCHCSTGPSAHPSPFISGDTESSVLDADIDVESPVARHLDALGYDISFRSWEGSID